MAKISTLDELTAPARGDTVLANDDSEPSVGSKTKRAKIEVLSEQQGAYAQPTAAQQDRFARAFALTPAGGLTDPDIGGRGGTSWRATTAALWAALPTTASTGTNTEKRGHAVITLTGETYSLRISWSTLWYSSGVSRRDVSKLLADIRKGDTVQLDSWTDNLGGSSITAQFLVSAAPVKDTSTESYVVTMKQVRTGAVIKPAHLVPAGSVWPTFGLSLGIRFQKALPLSDSTPKAPGTASPGTSAEAARADHVHPEPGVAALTDAASVVWDVAARPVAELTATSGVGASRTVANPTNASAYGPYALIFEQDTTGGRTLAFGSDYVFTGIGVASGAPPVHSGAGKRTMYGFVYVGSKMRCFAYTEDL